LCCIPELALLDDFQQSCPSKVFDEAPLNHIATTIRFVDDEVSSRSWHGSQRLAMN
jgi:hypothetical protein